MRSLLKASLSVLWIAGSFSPVSIGCAAHERVYDPYYHDYHAWNDHEAVYYGRWERETHRDHEDFNKRSDSEKKEYWDWRHSHH